MKNLLKMSDLSPAELTHILDVADQLKADCKAGRTAPLLAGKSVALLFSKRMHQQAHGSIHHLQL